jgi:hypothetical protein
MSCPLDLGLPLPDSARLWQAAADEEHQAALFGTFMNESFADYKENQLLRL